MTDTHEGREAWLTGVLVEHDSRGLYWQSDDWENDIDWQTLAFLSCVLLQLQLPQVTVFYEY